MVMVVVVVVALLWVMVMGVDVVSWVLVSWFRGGCGGGGLVFEPRTCISVRQLIDRVVEVHHARDRSTSANEGLLYYFL